MRIALIPDEFLPDGTRAHSRMIYELACQLKKLGHVPIVITPGTPRQANILQIDYIDDIEVWRFRSGYTRGVGMLRRGINEFLLSNIDKKKGLFICILRRLNGKELSKE